VLQEGGKDVHDFITASDKDLDPVLEKICFLATKDAFTEFAKIAGIAQKYNDEDLMKLNNETIQTFKEDRYLDDVFGSNSRLEYAVWVKESVAKALYMFGTKSLRNKLLEHAELEVKY
jgi:hypothetical protein